MDISYLITKQHHTFYIKVNTTNVKNAFQWWQRLKAVIAGKFDIFRSAYLAKRGMENNKVKGQKGRHRHVHQDRCLVSLDCNWRQAHGQFPREGYKEACDITLPDNEWVRRGCSVASFPGNFTYSGATGQ